MTSLNVEDDGAVFAFPQAICADCYHEQQHESERYCPHNHARAWFDQENETWLTEWPVKPQSAA